MTDASIYGDIARRTNGDIYIGVVGPVRTGKSTFIKQFMENVVLPNLGSDSAKARAVDELPQSAAGRTIMTTEPKFIPEQAAEIQLDNNARFKVRMIDCVGYIVPSSLGYIEGEQPRMVKTPWYDEDIHARIFRYPILLIRMPKAKPPDFPTPKLRLNTKLKK